MAWNGDPIQFNRARRPKYLFSGLTKCAKEDRRTSCCALPSMKLLSRACHPLKVEAIAQSLNCAAPSALE